MRWYIAENKRKIETEDMSEHFGDIDTVSYTHLTLPTT